MDAAVEQLQTLLELEARHEELLERLDDLDRRVAGVLAQYQTVHPPEQIENLMGDDSP
jgi:tetrahydromethanopterin S-methyltransferase subunit G